MAKLPLFLAALVGLVSQTAAQKPICDQPNDDCCWQDESQQPDCEGEWPNHHHIWSFFKPHEYSEST